jgi:hypothetical protein
MKRNDAGDFCILYVEPGDDRDKLLRTIIGQQKHIVLMPAEQAQLFQRSQEFVALKHIKRQLDVSIFFVIVRGERVTQLAQRNGFPVYSSMDALNQAWVARHPACQRVLMRASEELAPAPVAISSRTPRETVPLKPLEQDIADMPTRPIVEVPPSPSLQPSRVVRLATQEPSLSAMQKSLSPRANVPVQMSLSASIPSRVALPVTPPPVSPAARATLSSPAPAATPVTRPKKNAPRLPAVLIALMILALSAAGLASLLVFYHVPATSGASAPVVVGHVYFLSSGQVNENTNQGIDDEVQIDLHGLTNPAPGKKYYAWLLGDKSQGETQAILLGILQLHKGAAQTFYGDQAHTNLLAITSRFLVTEEDGSVMPIMPSPDYRTWRYYGEFLQTSAQSSSSTTTGSMSDMESHSSFLDHLRHLLATDPMLDQNELPGGLNSWFYHNTEKVLEWTGSMRETWEEGEDITFVRGQTVRTLTYLDGLSYVSRDIPPNTPLDLNSRLTRIGLIEVNGPNQDPPPYLDSIVLHLNGLMQAGGSTTPLRNEVAAIITAMNNVRYWLEQVRKDGQQIMKMSDAQLLQPSTLSLINDMITNASNAYAGQIDLATNRMNEGATWIHDHMQILATLDITPYVANSSPMQMIPPMKSLKLAWYVHEGKV